ncbi:MAG TPA: hypothetical protein VMZ53_05545, partial [Kofleriaceae bacterium]|nr:hypothetical protein [Kofleriaceae bacterium]
FGDKADATDELWELRASSDHWALVCGPTQKGCAWEPRSEASLAYLAATDSTFAIGGAGGNPRHEFKGAWILDDNEFIHSHDDPPARDFASMSYDPERKRIVVYGGNGVGCAGDCDGTWILESD